MPMATDRQCSNCWRRCQPDWLKNGRCPTCAKEHGAQDYKNRELTDPFHKMYQTPQWRKLSDMFKRQNPICLFIEPTGQQCRYKSDVVHHRIAAKERPDLFLDPKNLAALCNHHHGHTSGDAPGVTYMPAQFFMSYLPGQNLAEPNYSITAPPEPPAEGKQTAA